MPYTYISTHSIVMKKCPICTKLFINELHIHCSHPNKPNRNQQALTVDIVYIFMVNSFGSTMIEQNYRLHT